MKRLLLFFLAVLFVLSSRGALQMPGIFGNEMVFQRDMALPVWGKASPGAEITVQLGDATAKAVADDAGNWKAVLPSRPASAKPLELVVSGDGDRRVFQDVLVGEVWLCSGQSNMAMVVDSCNDAEREKADAANYPMIRQFKVPNLARPYPEFDAPGASWSTASPSTVGRYTAAGYFFARMLTRKLGVPVGILNSSWGGTRIEPWTTPEGFKSVEKTQDIYERLQMRNPTTDQYKKALREFLVKLGTWETLAQESLEKGVPLEPMPAFPADLIPYSDRQQPSTLYNGMLHPMVPFAIRGALWYQGEANRSEGMMYYEKTRALVNGWRQVWNNPDLPFYFVQLAPYKYGDAKQDSLVMGSIWEAQAECEKSIPNVWMAVTNDIGDMNDIHPKNKQDVGKRLCLLALHHTYGRKDIVCSGPKFAKMTMEEASLRIHFDHAKGLRTRDGKAPDCFEIVGPGTEFEVADARIDGETIVLSSPKVPKPTAFRFAWHKYSEPNLQNAAGLPCGACRAGDVPVVDYFAIKIKDAGSWQLVYDLPIAKGGDTIVYDRDDSGKVKPGFSKVAYFLELKKSNSSVEYVFVSMDAFTQDARKLGVPAYGTGAVFQQKVGNLTVVSNVSGVENVVDLSDAGFIEFWPNNYGPGLSTVIPQGSASKWDFNDRMSEPENGYGSMQVHNIKAGQTVFAYNSWKRGSNADLGIGNSKPVSGKESTKNTLDWTFNANAGQFEVKRLRVFVK